MLPDTGILLPMYIDHGRSDKTVIGMAHKGIEPNAGKAKCLRHVVYFGIDWIFVF
jgi:hypothetical protein